MIDIVNNRNSIVQVRNVSHHDLELCRYDGRYCVATNETDRGYKFDLKYDRRKFIWMNGTPFWLSPDDWVEVLPACIYVMDDREECIK